MIKPMRVHISQSTKQFLPRNEYQMVERGIICKEAVFLFDIFLLNLSDVANYKDNFVFYLKTSFIEKV
jgi:hypothetical protein